MRFKSGDWSTTTQPSRHARGGYWYQPITLSDTINVEESIFSRPYIKPSVSSVASSLLRFTSGDCVSVVLDNAGSYT